MKTFKPTLATVTYSTANDDAVVVLDVPGAAETGDDRMVALAEERALYNSLRAIASALRMFRETLHETPDA